MTANHRLKFSRGSCNKMRVRSFTVRAEEKHPRRWRAAGRSSLAVMQRLGSGLSESLCFSYNARSSHSGESVYVMCLFMETHYQPRPKPYKQIHLRKVQAHLYYRIPLPFRLYWLRFSLQFTQLSYFVCYDHRCLAAHLHRSVNMDMLLRVFSSHVVQVGQGTLFSANDFHPS